MGDFQVSNRGTALSIACEEGHLDIVELLLEFNANVNLPAPSGYTPLFLASQMVRSFHISSDLQKKGFSKIVSRLLESGVYVDYKGPGGCTALYAAAQKGYDDVGFFCKFSFHRFQDSRITLVTWCPYRLCLQGHLDSSFYCCFPWTSRMRRDLAQIRSKEYHL